MTNVPGYTAATFTAGEQPTTTKWNLLWANDAAFNTILGPAFTVGTANPAWQYLGSNSSSTTKTASNTTVDLGLPVTVTIPSGITKVRVILFMPMFYNSGSSGGNITGAIWDGTVGSGTLLNQGQSPIGINTGSPATVLFVGTLTAGSHTINGGISTTSTSVTAQANAGVGQLNTLVVECC